MAWLCYMIGRHICFSLLAHSTFVCIGWPMNDAINAQMASGSEKSSHY